MDNCFFCKTHYNRRRKALKHKIKAHFSESFVNIHKSEKNNV